MVDRTPEEALYMAVYDLLKAFTGRDAPSVKLDQVNLACKRLGIVLSVQSKKDAAVVCTRLNDAVKDGFGGLGKHLFNFDKRIRDLEAKLKALEARAETDKLPPNMQG